MKHPNDEDWAEEGRRLRYDEWCERNVRECSRCGGELVLVEKYAAVMYGNPEPACELWQCKCGHEEEG